VLLGDSARRLLAKALAIGEQSARTIGRVGVLWFGGMAVKKQVLLCQGVAIPPSFTANGNLAVKTTVADRRSPGSTFRGDLWSGRMAWSGDYAITAVAGSIFVTAARGDRTTAERGSKQGRKPPVCGGSAALVQVQVVGSGHFVPRVVPERVNAMIRRFLVLHTVTGYNRNSPQLSLAPSEPLS